VRWLRLRRTPLDGVEVATDEDGVIRLRGPMRAAGYLESRRVSTRASPRRLVHDRRPRLVIDGELVVHGRRDDMIISGGVKVPAIRIEQELAGLPGVRDLAVVGVADAEWGQRVRVVVVLEGGARTQLPSLVVEIEERLARRLPRTHAACEVVSVEGIVRTQLGKLSAAERGRLATTAPRRSAGRRSRSSRRGRSPSA
jgi:o-succinylbenzoate---CoA ligase